MSAPAYTLHHGDCLDVLPTIPDNSIDAIVTDPPAGIAFMGKDWDKDKGGRDEWIAWMERVAVECRRVLKPGAHALVWTIPRTSHWTAMAWENAGYEVRDKIAHLFGSGFPKSVNVGKVIDDALGAEREIVGEGAYASRRVSSRRVLDGGEEVDWHYGDGDIITAPATQEAKHWDGWGTALKPAREDWLLLRKPLEGTVVANVLKWGTGAINVDGCRIDLGGDDTSRGLTKPKGWKNSSALNGSVSDDWKKGRWPAHVTHDGSAEVVALFPVTTQADKRLSKVQRQPPGMNGIYGSFAGVDSTPVYGDAGSAARFFYCAKASKADRNEGLPDGEINRHPTVKATALMRWLVRLVTPPGGVVLDPFAGSGSTGKACMLEGCNFIGIERDAESVEIAKHRIGFAVADVAFGLFAGEVGE